MDWFSGWHWAIVAVVFLVLFGSSRLPGAAKALGSSMNIFKRSLKEGLGEDDSSSESGATTATVVQGKPAPQAQPQQIASQASDTTQQAQIEELQRQLQDLQRQSAANGTSADGAAAPAAQPQQPSS